MLRNGGYSRGQTEEGAKDAEEDSAGMTSSGESSTRSASDYPMSQDSTASDSPLSHQKSGGRVRVWVGVVIVVAAAALLAGWSLRAVLSPLGKPVGGRSYTFVPVVEGKVGDNLTLNTVAKWSSYEAGSNLAGGVVTTVDVNPGELVKSGTSIYTVNLRPVVVAEGQVPAFRAIELGTTGADVAQVQRMLAAGGWFDGEASGTADTATVSAIADWQEEMGVSDDGMVRLGDIIFVPELPARVILDSSVVARGATLSGGEPVLRAISGAPSFTITMTSAQAAMVSPNARVTITTDAGTSWRARTLAATFDEERGVARVELKGQGRRGVCGRQCDKVPVAGKAFYSARIVTVPTVTGSVIPTSALVTAASGEVHVTLEDGTRMAVRVLTSAQGMSIVDGVEPGTRVRTPGGPE